MKSILSSELNMGFGFLQAIENFTNLDIRTLLTSVAVKYCKNIFFKPETWLSSGTVLSRTII